MSLAACYGQDYWENFGSVPGNSYLDAARWRPSFAMFAAGLIAALHPESVFDAGCATGYLVEAFRERGVPAFGMDFSEYAIAHAQPGAQPYCWRGSLLDPPRLPHFDLAVCIEVLEHIAPEDVGTVIANLCALSDVVVFSSTPYDHTEPTHLCVREPEFWIERFGEVGFERDEGTDCTFITPWTMTFRRACPDTPCLTTP